MKAANEELAALADAIAALARGNADHSLAITELSFCLYRRLTPYSRGRREGTLPAQYDLVDALEAAEEALRKAQGSEEHDYCMWLQGCVERLQRVVSD